MFLVSLRGELRALPVQDPVGLSAHGATGPGDPARVHWALVLGPHEPKASMARYGHQCRARPRAVRPPESTRATGQTQPRAQCRDQVPGHDGRTQESPTGAGLRWGSQSEELGSLLNYGLTPEWVHQKAGTPPLGLRDPPVQDTGAGRAHGPHQPSPAISRARRSATWAPSIARPGDI
jgi:hypothetical protein